MFKDGYLSKYSDSKFAANNRQQIDDLRKNFSDFFESIGFTKIPAEPLIPRYDKTVLFSNATITPVKTILLEGEIPQNGLVIDQPCLRLQNLTSYSDENFQPHYMSFFHMVGIYHQELNEDTITAIWEVLKLSGINIDRISLEGCERDQDLADLMINYAPKATKYRVQKREEGYFDWKYDFKNFIGRGIHFMIDQGTERQPLSIGQIVEIKNDNKLVGYEFGFGVETFLSRRDLTSSIFEKGIGRELLPPSNARTDLQYQDLLTCSMAMCAAGVTPGKGRHRSLLRKTLRNITLLEELGDVIPMNENDIEEFFKQTKISLNSEVTTKVYFTMLQDFRKNIRNCLDLCITYYNERQDEIKRGAITSEYAEQKIMDYLLKQRIHPQLFEMTIANKERRKNSLIYKPTVPCNPQVA